MCRYLSRRGFDAGGFGRARLLLAAFILFAPLAISSARADEAETSPPSAALVRELIGWIGENTDYDIADALDDPPAVCFCEPGEEIDYEGRLIIVDERLKAAYDLPARRIYLTRPWDANDERNVSTLLHELVHDVQYSSRGWTCPEKTEWEAYKLQHAWLAERGIESGFDWLYVFSISRCTPSVHPD